MGITIHKEFVKSKHIVCINKEANSINFMFMRKSNENKTVINRIEQVLREKEITNSEFQAKIGIQSQHWNNWKNRGVPPKMIFTIAAELGINIDWLATGNGEKCKPITDVSTDKDLEVFATKIRRFVPLISYVQAGEWCEAIDNYAPGDAEDWLPCPSSHSESTYALRVRGDSMTNPIPGQPSYPEGVIVFVDSQRVINNGCRVIAKLPHSNEVTFKEYREDGGKRFLKPLNPQYHIQEIGDDTQICGVIIGKYESE